MKFTIFRGALSWIALGLLAPLTLPVLLNLWLARCFMVSLSKISKRAGIQEPIRSLEMSFSADNFYSSPQGANAFVWVLEGPIGIRSVRNKVERILLATENYNHYKRLTHFYPTLSLGYPFWVKKEKFSVESHFIEEEREIVGEAELNRVLCDYMKRPFAKDGPLWDIFYAKHFRSNGRHRAVFAFRIHHIVGDGKSMLEFLDKILDDSQEVDSQRKTRAKSAVHEEGHLKALIEEGQNLFWGPLVFLHLLKEFGWQRDFLTGKKQSRDLKLERTQMSLDAFKVIRKANFKEELLASVATCNMLLAGSLRSYFLKSTNGSIDLKGATRLIASLPVLRKGRTSSAAAALGTGFQNHWTHGIFKLPIDEKCRLQRKSVIIQDCRFISKFRFPQIYRCFLPLHGLIPFYLLKSIVAHNMGCPVGLTNLRGPQNPVFLDGKEVLQKWAIVGLQWPHAGMSAGFFSYNGNVFVSFLSNAELTPSTEITSLTKEFWAEVEANTASRKLPKK